MRLTSLLLIPAVAGVAGVAGAQTPAPGGGVTPTAKPPAPRALGAVVATSTDSLTTVGGVRALPNGRVLVNDPVRRRVLLLDERLAAPVVVVDSASGAENSYGPRGGGLIAWKGDSTLFVDPTSLSMLVIDPAGKVTRVMSVPRSDDAMALANGNAFGTPGVDAQGRLVYRAMPRFTMRRDVGGAPGGGGFVPGTARPAGPMPRPEMPDTMPLVRVDLASRKVDTLAWLKVPRPQVNMTTDDKGNMEVRVVANPLPIVDDFAVTSDGQVAVVRGRDYRVDWVQPDGSLSSTGRVPFDWKRMTDEDKEAFIDSVKAQRARQGTNAPTPAMFGMGGGGAGAPPPGAGGGMVITRTETREGGGGPPRTETRTSTAPNFEFVPASELPDYRPPFFANSARGDASGNLWIRTTSAPTVQGATVYDVVDRKGALVDRVQVPAGRQVAGFATDGTVLLAYRDGTVAKLEKVKLR